MDFYAHAVIELADGTRIKRGDVVPETLDGFDELVEGGSVSQEAYDETKDQVGPPLHVEIEGMRYIQVQDAGETDDVRA